MFLKENKDFPTILFNKMEKVMYEVEDHEENVQKMDKRSFKDYINDFMEEDDAKSIRKTYWYNNKKIRMTLFTLDHDFTPDEYIDHYRSLSSDLYGKDFMSDFDIFIIKKFNK